MTESTNARPSPIAGLWYSDDASYLSQQIGKFIQQAQLPELDGDVVGVIAPHAGHRYSGKTAGYAFRAIQGQRRDLVVIVSPLHALAPATVLTSAHAAYATPLGKVRIDEKAMKMLADHLKQQGVGIRAIRNDQEHSLEILLPFIQCALINNFELMPIMISTRSIDIARKLGSSLGTILNTLSQTKSILLVGSTDLSHFYPEHIAQQLDQEMIRRIESLSPEAVLEADNTGKAYACGAAAVASVLTAAKALGTNKAIPLHHSTSGDETGDRESVVGYGSVALIKNK